MNRSLKISLIFTGVFLCGAVVGGVATHRFFRSGPPPGRAGNAEDTFPTRIVRRLNADLGLTAEQRALIEPIVKKTGEELRRLRKESTQQTSIVYEEMNTRLAEHLTPEQRERFAELRAAQRQRMKSFMDERQRAAGGADRREGAERPRRPEGPPPPREEKDSR